MTAKIAAKPTNYDNAFNALIVDFQKKYIPEGILNDDGTRNQQNTSGYTEQEINQILLSIDTNSEIIKDIVDKYVTPVYCKALRDNQEAKKELEQAVASLKHKETETGKTKSKRKISSWQIYLKYASKLIPGYKESTNKMALCKEHYKQMSEEEMKELCNKYFEENPQAKGVEQGVSTNKGTKRGGATGWGLFSKQWYEEQKKKNPDAKGLQSKSCAEAWKALTEAEKAEYNYKASIVKQNH
jgi:hypothetical protein